MHAAIVDNQHFCYTIKPLAIINCANCARHYLGALRTPKKDIKNTWHGETSLQRGGHSVLDGAAAQAGGDDFPVRADEENRGNPGIVQAKFVGDIAVG